jgi:hypothetical protein
MPESPFVPPPRKPVSTFPTPSPAVAFYTELVNRTDPAYVNNAPVKRGTRYSTIIGANRGVIAQYPELFFLGERKFQLNDQLVLWDWATDEQAHDTYNAEVTYVANDITYPAFTRVYTVRRELYESNPTLPIGSALDGIVAVDITDPGQDYTSATGTIPGTDIAIQFTVDDQGHLLQGIITDTGADSRAYVTLGQTITITGDGSGAKATAVTQPTGCVLTSQKKEELGQDDPLKNELVRVTRVYETLPGPFITTTRFDKDGAIITSSTRRNISDSVIDNDIILNGQWIQTFHKGVDGFVCEETVESRPVPGNLIASTKVEEDGKILSTLRRLVETTQGISSERLSGGIWFKDYLTEVDDSTLIKVHQASNLVSYQVQESRPIPGNPLVSSKLDDDGIPVFVTTTLKDTTTISTAETLIAGTWTHTTKEFVSDLVAKENVQVRAIPGNPMTSEKIDPDGMPVSIVTTLKDASVIVPAETLAGTVWTSTTSEAVSDLVSKEIVASRVVPGNPMTVTRVEEDGMTMTIQRILSDQSLITTSETLISGIWTKTYQEDPPVFRGFEIKIGDLVAWKMVESRPIPGNVLVSTDFERDGVTKTTSKQLVATSSVITDETLTPNLLTRYFGEAVSDLVSKQVIETITVTSDSLLDLDHLTTEIPNVIPEIFRALIPTHIERHIVEGAPTEPALILGELEHSERAITPLYKEVTSTLFDIGMIPITITGLKETDRDKEVVTVSMTLELDTTTPSTPNALVDVEFRKLGNGLAVETLRTVPEVFPHGSYTKSVVDLIPPELRAKVPLVETDETSAGTASTDPTLLVGELSRNEEQVDKFDKRVRVKSLGNIVVPVSITATETDRDKQIVSVVYTLELSGTNAVVPTALIDVDVKDLGNGYEVVTTKTVPTVFPSDSYTISIVNLIPERLRAAIPITETSIDESGSPSTSPVLLTGELSRTESRLTEFTKRTRIAKLGTIVVPVTITGQETSEVYGGGILDVTVTLDSVSLVPDQGLTVVNSNVTNLGNGYFVKETRKLGADLAAWPANVGTHVNEQYGISVGITKQVVDAGTTGGLAGGTYTEIKSIDKWRSMSIASKLNLASLPGDTQWFSGQRHSFPPELSDAVIDWAEGTCGCSDSFSAVLIANMNQYTGMVKTRVTEQFYNGVPPDDVVITQFFPHEHTFGFAWASACGSSDTSCRTKSGAPKFYIPLCLHGDLTLTIGAFITFSFPATTPAVLPHGSYIMLPPHVERWRFGVFRRVLTEVLVP